MNLTKILETIYNAGAESSLDVQSEVVNEATNSISPVPYVRTLVKTFAERAFEEGYYSNYSEKEEILADIVNKLDKKLGNLRNIFEPDKIYSLMPDKIRKILAISDNIWLAGGSVVRLILDKDWESDWDIFCTPRAYNSLMSQAFKDVPIISNKSSAGYTNISANDATIGDVHIIVGNYTTGNDVFSNFDITICQFTINKFQSSLIHGSNQSWEDLHNGVIRINQHAVIDAERTYQRVQKYKSRGFTESSQKLVIPSLPQAKPYVKKRKAAPPMTAALKSIDWSLPARYSDLSYTGSPITLDSVNYGSPADTAAIPQANESNNLEIPMIEQMPPVVLVNEDVKEAEYMEDEEDGNDEEHWFDLNSSNDNIGY